MLKMHWCAFLLFNMAIFSQVNAQLTNKVDKISEIITDFNNFWKSGIDSAAISPIRPDNSHNLLAFKYNGTYYSTGVNNPLLTSRNIAYIPGDYRALPVTSVASPTSSTFIGLGQLYDGVDNGPSNPAPVNNVPFYLTDGPKGLNLGTAVYNLPTSNIKFDVSNFQVPKIGDNIPDIIVTQMGDISSTGLDLLYFTDANGDTVGNSVTVRLAGLDTLGLGVFDFYTANTDPMTIASGNSFIKSPRAVRFFAADLSAFGLNGTNVTTVKYFTQKLNGTSDIAFTAYNTEAIKILPLNNPGGFSTFPGLWLKANDGSSTVSNNSKMAQWQDRGPSGFSLEQSQANTQPQFKNGASAGFNFNPYINFDNSNRLVSANSPFTSETGDGDFFIVGRPTNTTAANKIIGFSRSAADNLNASQGDFPALNYTATGASFLDNANFSNALTGNTTSLNKSYLWRAEYTNGAATNFYKNGTADGTGGVGVSVGKHSFQIGDAAPGDAGSDFDLAEIIVFPVNLSNADRIKVETYMAIKYGLTLSHNYVNAASQTVWSLTANSGYNNNVFGIGREDAQGLYQKQSKSETGTGMVAMGIGTIASENTSNLNSLNDVTYSITGDDGGALTWQTTEKPAKIDFRIGREWKVRETGNIGTLRIQVPANTSTQTQKLPASSTCKMFMLVDNDGDFSSGIIAQVEMTLNGTNWEGNYNFADGNYFTFATENKDYGDLPTTWPSAAANVNGCDTNGDGMYSNADNNTGKLLVWAGAAVTSEVTANTNNTDVADDGLQANLSNLFLNALNPFTIQLNSNQPNTTVYYRMWFDWNNDGNFANDNSLDANTLSTVPATYAGSAVTNGTSPTSITVNIRLLAAVSLAYKVRLIVSNEPIEDMYRLSSSSYQFAIANGEIEDYVAPVALPVTLQSFTATVQNCNALLRWQTATEQNSSSFAIEHSTDGVQFTTVGSVAAKNISTGSAYTFYANQLQQGANYLRLKMIDRDGKTAYSAVEKLHIDCSKTKLIVGPNPVKSNLYISGLLRNTQLIIYDATGRTLLNQATGNAASINLDLQGWLPGTYSLQIIENGKPVETRKFLKM